MSAKIIKVQQGTPEWLAHRAKHFNASDAPAMLGVSSYMTRGELLRQKATGFVPEVETATQRRFDKGHEYEAVARPWAEEIIGSELYPVVLAEEIDGLPMSASVDGIDMMDEVAWEHKTLNERLAASLDEGVIPDEYHPQMEQILMLTGAKKCLFMASAGERESMRCAWYEPNQKVRDALVRGWKQFAEDLAEYEHTEEAAPIPAGKAPETLPALRIEVTGMVTASNLDEFREQAMSLIESVNTDLQTDEDFASAEKAVKWCKDVETRLDAAKEHALSQTASIDELFRTVDAIKEEARSKRLELDKLVKARKEAIRGEIMAAGKKTLADHIARLEERIKPLRLPAYDADFAGAMKGKKTVKSLRDAVDDVLARAKIDTNQMADEIAANVKALDELAGDEYHHLFADLQQIATKPVDDFAATVKARIAEHKEAEQRRLEAERERIRAEEERKAQEKIRQEEARKARERAETAKPQKSAVAATQELYSQPDDTRAPGPSAGRPSDEQIIEVLALHYRVHESKVIEWLLDMDLQAESEKLASNF